jgi:preprotein translocase subunit YajC
MEQLILPILLFGGMYMLLIRPQQRKVKDQKALVERAGTGDRVMLASGIYGTITEVLDTAAYIELAEGIEVLVNRIHIQEILDEFPTKAETPKDESIDDEDAVLGDDEA